MITEMRSMSELEIDEVSGGVAPLIAVVELGLAFGAGFGLGLAGAALGMTAYNGVKDVVEFVEKNSTERDDEEEVDTIVPGT